MNTCIQIARATRELALVSTVKLSTSNRPNSKESKERALGKVGAKLVSRQFVGSGGDISTFTYLYLCLLIDFLPVCEPRVSQEALFLSLHSFIFPILHLFPSFYSPRSTPLQTVNTRSTISFQNLERERERKRGALKLHETTQIVFSQKIYKIICNILEEILEHLTFFLITLLKNNFFFQIFLYEFFSEN